MKSAAGAYVVLLASTILAPSPNPSWWRSGDR
jgi:hypothetical protein